MSILKTRFDLYLSEPLGVTVVGILEVYYKSLVSKISDAKLQEKAKYYLDKAYDKYLGEGWRDLVPEENNHTYMVLSNFPRYPGPEGAKYNIATLDINYPTLNKDIPLTNYQKRSLLKLYNEITDEKYRIRIKIMGELTKDGKYFPGAETYGDLKRKYPEVFEVVVQNYLEKYDSVQIISEETEIKELSEFCNLKSLSM